MGNVKKIELPIGITDVGSFTDRKEPQKAFFEKANEIVSCYENNDETYAVIYYHGLAGIGKTFLLNYLKYSVDHREREGGQCPELAGKEIDTVFCDLEKEHTRLDVLELLMTEMAKKLNYSFPLTAAAIFKIKLEKEIPEWKGENKAKSMMESKPVEIAKALLKLLPIAGKYVGLASDLQAVINETKNASELWDSFERALTEQNEIQAIKRIRNGLNFVNTINNNLHTYFCQDMVRNIREKKEEGKGPIVMFLDTFEAYLDNLKKDGSAETISWIQEMIQSIPYVLWVIAGRERLFEDKNSSGWEECDVVQIDIDRFKSNDVSDYLSYFTITNPSVQRQFYLQSGGIPYLLHLFRISYEKLKQDGKEYSFNEYGGKDTQDIVVRYLKYLSRDEKYVNLLYQLSLFKDGWTDETIEGFDLDYYDRSTYDVICRNSVIEKSGDGIRRIQRTIREVIENQARKERPDIVCKTEEVLKNHYQREVDSMDSIVPVTPMLRLLECCTDDEKETVFTEILYNKLAASFYQLVNNAEIVLDTLKPLARRGTVSKEFLLCYMNLQFKVEEKKGRPEKALEIAAANFTLWKSKYGELDVSLVNDLANGLFQMGLYKEAAEMQEECYKKDVEIFGYNHPNTLIGLNNLALYLGKLGNYSEALKKQEECYQRTVSVFGENHLESLRRLIVLAGCYDDLGRYEEALSKNEECYQKMVAVLGENHPETLTCLNNLARCYENMGRYKEALGKLEECYQKTVAVLGENHPESLRYLNNLATCYSSMERFEEALSKLEECYQKTVAVLGESHPESLKCLNNLACCYRSMERYEEALVKLEECYQKTVAALGENHTDSLTYLSNLATCYSEMGRYEEALVKLEECYQKTVAVLGENHPDSLRRLNNLALCYSNMGKNEEALGKYEECYQKTVAALGEKHPESLTCLNNLATCYSEMGRYEEALGKLEECYQKTVKVFGESHPDSLRCLNNLAVCYRRMGRHKKALDKYEESYRKAAAVLGENHPNLLAFLYNAACCYQDIGRYEEAIKKFEEYYKKEVSINGENSRDLLNCLLHIASCYLKLGEGGKALQKYDECYKIMLKVFGKNNPRTMRLLEEITFLKIFTNANKS